MKTRSRPASLAALLWIATACVNPPPDAGPVTPDEIDAEAEPADQADALNRAQSEPSAARDELSAAQRELAERTARESKLNDAVAELGLENQRLRGSLGSAASRVQELEWQLQKMVAAEKRRKEAALAPSELAADQWHGRKDCAAEYRYANLRRSWGSTSGKAEYYCIDEAASVTVILWNVGCPACVVEFQDLLVPALEASPALAQRVVTGFLVDDRRGDSELLRIAAETLEGVPELAELRNIVIERKRATPISVELDRQLDELEVEQVYPSFMHFDGDGYLLVQPKLADRIAIFDSSGDYFGALQALLSPDWED